MTAPLALFLTHFTAPPPAVEMSDFVDEGPSLSALDEMPSFDSSGEIETAVEAAKVEVQERYDAEMLALRKTHEEELAQALAAAREDWLASTSVDLTTSLESAIGALRVGLSDGLAAVLRPLVADTVRARVSRELTEALDRLLADSSQPILRVRGPEDLCAALHAARPSVEIDWVIDESTEIEMIAGSTMIETKLAVALADIAATEL